MRHLNAGRRLGRTTEHRHALLSNLVTALIQHERIQTTLPKAKEARRVADKMITLAKRQVLHSRRLAGRTIRDAEALSKLFGTLGPRFANRNGGYTRIVRLGHRLGDAAPMAILELVERSPKVAPEETETAGKPAKTDAQKAKAAAQSEAKTEAKKKATAAKAEAKAAKPAAEASKSEKKPAAKTEKKPAAKKK
jgi:large subunit ribosomal protein L17